MFLVCSRRENWPTAGQRKAVVLKTGCWSLAEFEQTNLGLITRSLFSSTQLYYSATWKGSVDRNRSASRFCRWSRERAVMFEKWHSTLLAALLLVCLAWNCSVTLFLLAQHCDVMGEERRIGGVQKHADSVSRRHRINCQRQLRRFQCLRACIRRGAARPDRGEGQKWQTGDTARFRRAVESYFTGAVQLSSLKALFAVRIASSL